MRRVRRFNVFEACRHHPVSHLGCVGCGSVYGGNEKVLFSESDRVDLLVSLYAAIKKVDGLIAAMRGVGTDAKGVAKKAVRSILGDKGIKAAKKILGR